MKINWCKISAWLIWTLTAELLVSLLCYLVGSDHNPNIPWYTVLGMMHLIVGGLAAATAFVLGGVFLGALMYDRGSHQR